MPLEPPHLDDRRFQDLVDEMKRMIPRFTPEWTNHNVGDPGVALIELFAWTAEMVLYRVNQVPDRLYTHFLNLVGVEPFPPSAARTDLTFWFSAPAAGQITVPADTEVSTVPVADDEPVTFSTVHSVTVEPPQLVAARTGIAGSALTLDTWESLTVPGQSALCFGSLPVTAGDALYLGLARSAAGHVLRLDIAARAEGVGIDPLAPPVAWEAWSGTAWVPVSVESDTTGGLNKTGAVVVLMPDQHEPIMLDGTHAHWLRVRLIPQTTGRPTYQTSPRIDELQVSTVGVTVQAEHTRRVSTESVGRSTGVPAQSFTVAHTPVAARRSGEEVVVVTDGVAHAWQEVADFAASGPSDRHVVWDSATGEIRFGPMIRQPDGSRRQCGAVPPDGAHIQVSGYRSGGGARGNVGARTLVTLRSAVPYIASVTNLGPASGGVDAETSAEAKVRGPLTLRSSNRSVTAGDYEQIARRTSVEVARAHCLPADESGVGRVRVLVVPDVRTRLEAQTLDDFALNRDLWEQVSRALEETRPVGVAVEVGAPFYQGVSIAALVRALPGRPVPVVRQRVEEALTRYVHPLIGGQDGTGWPFETQLTQTALVQAVELVDGVLAVDELQIFEYDLRTGRRIGDGHDSLPLAPNSLFLPAAHRVVVR